MIELVSNTIDVRGVSYTVREMAGKDTAGLRKLGATDADRSRQEPWLVSVCCLTPKFTEKEAAELPQFLINALVSEIQKLTKGAEDEPKKD